MSRSYPHPVLGNRDDITIGSINPTVSTTITEQFVVLSLSGLCTGNPDIDDLVASGKATWIVRIECARTYFRQEQSVKSPQAAVTITGAELEGRVNIAIGIAAVARLDDYHPAGLHPDYGHHLFTIEAGELLAIQQPPVVVDVDKEFDPLKAPASGLIRLTEGADESGPFTLDLEGDRIIVQLSKEDWAQLDGISDRMPGVLHTSIVLPVLVGVLHHLDRYEGDGHLWASRLAAICAERDIETGDPLRAAQQLLESPVFRAFQDLNAQLDREYE